MEKLSPFTSPSCIKVDPRPAILRICVLIAVHVERDGAQGANTWLHPVWGLLSQEALNADSVVHEAGASAAYTEKRMQWCALGIIFEMSGAAADFASKQAQGNDVNGG